MSFITLTQAHKDKEVVINVERIESFQEHHEGAMIITTEGTHLVEQTPEEIKIELGMLTEKEKHEIESGGMLRAYEEYLRRDRNG